MRLKDQKILSDRKTKKKRRKVQNMLRFCEVEGVRWSVGGVCVREEGSGRGEFTGQLNELVC